MKKYKSSYNFTCKKCRHEFDFDEGLKLGGYFSEDWIECPMCKSSDILDNESLNEKLYL